jgi:hypothetical protein
VIAAVIALAVLGLVGCLLVCDPSAYDVSDRQVR